MDYQVEARLGGARLLTVGPDRETVATFAGSPSGDLAFATFVGGLVKNGAGCLFDMDNGRFIVAPAIRQPEPARSPAFYAQQVGPVLRPRYRRAWWQFWKPARPAVRVTIL